MKTFLTEKQIVDLVREGNETVSESDFKRLRKIGEKIGITLEGLRTDNARAVYEFHRAKMVVLPVGDKFRQEWDAGRKSWGFRQTDPEMMKAYLKHVGAWDDYVFLADLRWDRLHTFCTSRLRSFGVDTAGLYQKIIATGGDYREEIEKAGKKFADPEAIKKSAEVKKAVDGIFTGLGVGERMLFARRLMEYAAKPELTGDEFHNLINK